MFSTLRNRLVVSYAALALFSVVVASGAALFLFGRSLEGSTQREMVNGAVRLANTIATVADGSDPEQLQHLLFSPRMRTLGVVMAVDETGRPIASWTGRPMPPEYQDGLFPPPRGGQAGQDPDVRQARLPSGAHVAYVSLPLPADLATAAGAAEAWLTIVRPQAEVRGLWRAMLRPVLLVASLAAALAALLGLALARTITHPVEQLTRGTERVAHGDYSARVEVSGGTELASLATAFNTMSQAVGDAQRRQRDFVANVSHDLRTPLTTIRGFAAALVDGTATTADAQRRAATAIDGAAARMDTLVSTLIDLARLEGHRVSLDLRPVSVRDLLTEQAHAAAPAAAQRQVQLVVGTTDGLVVQADPAWLGRALGNVVDNAVRHGAAGGTVTLSAAPEDGFVAVAVVDDGPGIAPEDLPRVFERFYRGDKARSTGGSGLGLAIAREIVEEHGGRIDLASAPGAGTRVVLRVPSAP